MQAINEASRTKRGLLIKIIKEFQRGNLENNIDRIPYDMRPKEGKSTRCCVYKDRALLKYRIMAMLGIGVETETDELKPLCEYLKDAEKRQQPDSDILSVLDVACSHCITSRYLITNACRGCYARPCVMNCPKDAIKITDGHAEIDYDLCINCGKCVDACPYHAIIKVNVPCEEVCPVDAIRRDEATGKQYIDFDACISCGKCMIACPFGAILERSQIIDILHAIRSGKQVVAMVAPAIIGQFSGKIGQIAAAIIKSGFHKMVEVALGAEITTKHEVKDFTVRMARGDKLMTTSCCPAYTETVKRHVPEMLPFLSDAKTPMQYTAEKVKNSNPETVTVFIGPCIAKRKEASEDMNTDYVMTFEELGAMFAALEIDVATEEIIPLEHDIKGYARGFARSCGVSTAVLEEIKTTNPAIGIPEFNGSFIDGIDKKAVKQLSLYAKGENGNFLEVMACQGGCVGGPCTIGKIKLAIKAVEKFALQ
jgi:[FeFe] hydrogenase (group B1/B3)